MTNVASFPAGEPEDLPPVRPEPRLFVRAIATPPGLPWDQARAAALEARVGAPLPLAEVVHRVRRLETWALGKPGRYAVVYVRAQEVGDSFSAAAQVEGQSFEVRFHSRRERERIVRRLVLVGGAAAAAALILIGSVTAALAARQDREAQLAGVEQTVAARLRGVEARQRLEDEARALRAEGVRGLALADVLQDLAWASENKKPGARVQAFHWDRGYMAVEVRGGEAPFVDGGRELQKSDRPVAPGVWLWGVAPEGAR